MKRVLITGATGLIGTRLTALLQQRNYEVGWLVRKPLPKATVRTFLWDPEHQKIDIEAVKGVDYIVHLAGENIAKEKWTPRRKKLLLESRTMSSMLLAQSLQKTPYQVKAVVAASAIGYYGHRGDEWVSESDGAGNDFLADLCVQWEAANELIARTCRLTQLRIGIVLSVRGGALPELAKPIRWGIAAYPGNGKQYLSWIHIDDLCAMIIHALESASIEGIYNAVAPVPVQLINLVDAIGAVLNKPGIHMPVPSLVLKIMLGEMSAALLHSCRATSDKIEKAGFSFQYRTPLPALNDLFNRGI